MSCRALAVREKLGEGVCYETGGECDRAVRLKKLKSTPEASDALRLFLAAQTQMRVGMSGAVGFDYPACEIVARSLGIDFRAVLPFFRVIERAYLAEVERASDARRSDRKT